MSRWYIDFREKGENARCGGFFRADTDEERDEIANQLKEQPELRVVWAQIKEGPPA